MDKQTIGTTDGEEKQKTSTIKHGTIPLKFGDKTFAVPYFTLDD